ncbi:MAG: hypothetical protein FWE76_06465 [Symbiobacteriaceae bacterium]|nr:hypothetical protein [Symbiobacteriaceae bacterium]
MRHLFIVNPASGTANKDEIIRIIDAFATKQALQYRIHRTSAPFDAEETTRKAAEESPEDIVIYSCGGDGTLNEIVNGARGANNVIIGIVPIGSGNDFIKNFAPDNAFPQTRDTLQTGEADAKPGDTEHPDPDAVAPTYIDSGKGIASELKPFLDLKAQIEGAVVTIDLLEVNQRLAINMANVGLDAVVARNMTKFRKLGVLHNELPYSAAVLVSILRPLNRKVQLTIDDNPQQAVSLTILVGGNGSYYGGGYKAAPQASLDDGLLDLSLISPVNHLELPKLLSLYKQGQHLQHPTFEGRLLYTKCHKWQVHSQRELTYAVDGETSTAKEITVTMKPHCQRILIPRGLHMAGSGQA